MAERTTHTIPAPRRLHPNRPLASTIDIAKAIVGIWLFVSTTALTPHAISQGTTAPLLNNMIVGGVLLLTSVAAAMGSSSTDDVMRPAHRRTWSYLTGALGVWLIISPWILGYGGTSKVAMNDVICGLVLIVLAATNYALSRSMGHDRHHGFVR
jgi:SPW repeat-containing protein